MVTTMVGVSDGGGDDDSEWMSSSRAAAYLGVTPRTLYRLIDGGLLPAYRFGRVLRLRTADVVLFRLSGDP